MGIETETSDTQARVDSRAESASLGVPATQSIHQALIKVQAKAESLARDTLGQVGAQKFKYGTLDALREMLRPLLADNGLGIIHWVDGDSLYTKVIHESGSSMTFGGYPLGAFTKDQDRGKAITYARRYHESAIFGIAQEEDPDKAQAVWPSKKAREAFRLTTINAIDMATDRIELNEIWTGHGKKINEMTASTNGDDQLVAQEIFALLQVRGKQFDQAKKLERQADDGNFESPNEQA